MARLKAIPRPTVDLRNFVGHGQVAQLSRFGKDENIVFSALLLRKNQNFILKALVEPRGIELLASSLQRCRKWQSAFQQHGFPLPIEKQNENGR